VARCTGAGNRGGITLKALITLSVALDEAVIEATADRRGLAFNEVARQLTEQLEFRAAEPIGWADVVDRGAGGVRSSARFLQSVVTMSTDSRSVP
jgi:hypothetical protein